MHAASPERFTSTVLKSLVTAEFIARLKLFIARGGRPEAIFQGLGEVIPEDQLDERLRNYQVAFQPESRPMVERTIRAP